MSARARETPNARIALIGGRRNDVVKVMIDGKSGIRAIAHLGEKFDWKPSLGTLRFGNGAMAFIYSPEAPEGLRLAPEVSLYATAYRPLRCGGKDEVQIWRCPLALGAALPVLPLSLRGDLAVRYQVLNGGGLQAAELTGALPEPASLALLGLGIAGLLGRRRR